MTENQISTISEFLLHAGTDYRAFDMGRGIRQMSSQSLLDIELGKIQPQFVRLQHVWFGLVFWDKTRSSEHYIWFIKLPVDEQGLVIAATRNHFLQIIIDALGAQLENARQNAARLPENPYTFVPNQQQLADFNSISRVALKLDSSQFYQSVRQFLDAPSVIDWHTLPLQGLTDITARLHQDGNLSALLTCFEQLPLPVVNKILLSLENHKVEAPLAEKIQTLLNTHPEDPTIWQHGLRALAQSPCSELVSDLIRQVLDGPLRQDAALLMIIAGRLWQHLNQQSLLTDYLLATASTDQDFQLFIGIFSDLVQLPALRPTLLGWLRQPNKPEALQQAVGALFSANEES